MRRENYDSIGKIDATSVTQTGNGKGDFRFPFFCLSLFPSSHPYSPSGKKFERVESMKGVENKGTTIVEGTKTSSLKFQRLASLRRKKNKKKKEKKEREKRKKTPCRHLERREKEGNRELPCITGRYISAETFFVRPIFSTINSSTLFLQLNTTAIVIDFVIVSLPFNGTNEIFVTIIDIRNLIRKMISNL